MYDYVFVKINKSNLENITLSFSPFEFTQVVLLLSKVPGFRHRIRVARSTTIFYRKGGMPCIGSRQAYQICTI